MVNFGEIEKKWQDRWEKAKIFQVKENPRKKKFYCLEMYPYPSGLGLHMGHARNYAIGDCYARFKRMQGFNVLYPMGYDSFGLPAENAAIQAKSHPKLFTEKAIQNFIKQQKELGFSYDWSRMIMSHSSDYYKWDQWIFLKLLEKGLAYKKRALVNWCPRCNTVLANEQVHDGICWRHEEQEVELKELEQWFFRITDYADRLLKGLSKLKDWPEDVKLMQENWIGKSEGIFINFKLKDSDESLSVFTTRPDTLYGVTFIVLASQHPKILKLIRGTKYEKEIKSFINKSVKDRFSVSDEKEGLFIGKYAINPLTKEKIPIYIANFVLMEYGTGAVMAVPAHDQRDFEFAKKYKIPIKIVIQPKDKKLNVRTLDKAYIDNGILINSGQFNRLDNKSAIEKISDYLEKKNLGKRTIEYKLKDWLVSRQRFWGCPIPIIYCDKCGIVPVPEKDLPVKLPDNIRFTSSENPLVKNKKFVDVKCPKCKGKAKRETDTMDTFVDSSWYFLRYCDPKNKKEIFDKKKVAYWMPVDQYIGGKQHATMHLIYFRFFTKFFKDLGLVKFDEPALKLFNQGMLHKNGVVMSKSKGNVVLPEEISNKYGIDTGRLFLLFVASPDKDMEWDDKGVEGSFRFLNRIYRLSEKEFGKQSNKKLLNKMHRAIRDVTDDIENFRFNSAIIKLMDYVNYLSNEENVSKEGFEVLIKMLNPFTPHLSEELWERLGNKSFVSLEKWPSFDKNKIDDNLEYAEVLVNNVIKDIKTVLRLIKKQRPRKIHLFVIPKEVDLLMEEKEILKKEFNCKIDIVDMRKSKLLKARKAKPGKPAIFVD